MATLRPEDHAMLAHAVHHQCDTAVRLLFELGFDPAAGGTDGGTALHQAAWVGRADYVELLLPRCASIVSQPDPTHHSTPLGWAAYGSVHRCNEKGDYVRTIEVLAAAGADLSRPGLLSAADGNTRVQEALRKLGVT
jgi:ankyrin repeat protein